MEINTKEILQQLDNTFNTVIARQSSEHDDHKRRIAKAIDWWRLNFISQPPADNDEYKFVGAVVNVNDVKCCCVLKDFTGMPFFNCEFHFRPLQANENAGSGNGARHIVKF